MTTYRRRLGRVRRCATRERRPRDGADEPGDGAGEPADGGGEPGRKEEGPRLTSPHGPQPSRPGGTARASEVTDDLCRVQADLLGMGPDNYQRLRRICPDPERRYRVLRARVEHRLGVVPSPSSPAYSRPAEGTTALAAGGGMQLELEWQGTPRDPRSVDDEATSADAFVVGEPAGSDRCWRCNARSAAGDLGLCEACHASLVAGGPDEEA